MISRIQGEIIDMKDDMLVIKAGAICYEVLVPLAVMGVLEKDHRIGTEIDLVTYHYHQVDPSRSIPVLIGFQNYVEREFFEKFISISGIGPKAACKALAEPFSYIAGAIDSGDIAFLKKLPRIGERKAAEIVARLKGKVGKYGLIRDQGYVPSDKGHDDVRNEALEVLLQLQYKKQEAEGMIDRALKDNPSIKTSEELLNEVYKEKKIL